jgi:serine/threonine protein phosphatase PrpC
LASAGDSTSALVQWLGDNDQSSGGRTKSFPWYRNLWKRGPEPARDIDPPYKILAQSVKHKPADFKERMRIENAGGTVHIPFDPEQTSRVVYPVEDETNGMVMQMALAMSRSLGDKDGKQLGVVIADPDVVTVDLKDHLDDGNRFFLVLASDGVSDMVPEMDALAPLGRALFDNDKDAPLLETVVEGILTAAAQEWGRLSGNTYRDDISLTVHKIDLVS